MAIVFTCGNHFEAKCGGGRSDAKNMTYGGKGMTYYTLASMFTYGHKLDAKCGGGKVGCRKSDNVR